MLLSKFFNSCNFKEGDDPPPAGGGNFLIPGGGIPKKIIFWVEGDEKKFSACFLALKNIYQMTFQIAHLRPKN